jgi:citronellol/citronellal dehydrogenase
VDTFGGIDILINNASAINLGPVEEMATKTFDLVMSINTRGTFLASKHAIPHLRKSKNPHILTISPPLYAINDVSEANVK